MRTLRFFVTLAAIGLTLILPPEVFAQRVQQIEITSATANARVGAGTNHAIAGQLRRGTVLEVLGREGAWYRVRITPELGFQASVAFVHESTLREIAASTVVEPVATTAAPAPNAEPQRSIRAGERVRLNTVSADMHADPDFGSPVRRQLRSGDVGTVLETRREWAHLAVGGAHGWVAQRFLEPVITAEIESAAGYKDPGNAMWLGILPGAGHFYIGNNRKGTILAGIGAGFALLLAKGYSDPLESSGYATIGGLGLSLTMGYSSWSAYQDAHKHNDALRRTTVILYPHTEGGVAVGIRLTH